MIFSITASGCWSHFLIGNKGSHMYNGNNYKCEKCLKIYKRESNFKQHKCPYCDVCKTRFSTFQIYTGHKCVCQSSHKLTSCTPEQASYTKCSVETQQSDVTNSKNFSCSFCSRKYKSLKTLNNHKCPFCKTCNKLVSSFKWYKSHQCKGAVSSQQNQTQNINYFSITYFRY